MNHCNEVHRVSLNRPNTHSLVIYVLQHVAVSIICLHCGCCCFIQLSSYHKTLPCCSLLLWVRIIVPVWNMVHIMSVLKGWSAPTLESASLHWKIPPVQHFPSAATFCLPLQPFLIVILQQKSVIVCSTATGVHLSSIFWSGAIQYCLFSALTPLAGGGRWWQC